MLYFERIDVSYPDESLASLRSDPRFVNVARHNRLTSSSLKYGQSDSKATLFKTGDNLYGHFGDQVFQIDRKDGMGGRKHDSILVNTECPEIAREVFSIITGEDLKKLLDDYVEEKRKSRQSPEA